MSSKYRVGMVFANEPATIVVRILEAKAYRHTTAFKVEHTEPVNGTTRYSTTTHRLSKLIRRHELLPIDVTDRYAGLIAGTIKPESLTEEAIAAGTEWFGKGGV